MAVENKWVDTDVEAGKKGNPANVAPASLFGFATTFEVAAADDNGSIYKLCKLGANLIPLQIKINNDAITGGTSYDLGLYSEAGVAKDADCFAAAADMSSAHAMGSELDGLTAHPIDEIGSAKLYEIAGDTIANKDEAYVLAFTANTAGSAAGTISVRGLFLQG